MANKIKKTKEQAETKEQVVEAIHIPAPNIKTGTIWIKGTAPLVVHKFSKKAQDTIIGNQTAGSPGKNTGKKRPPKDFNELFNGARHISFEGWDGIPASAIRAASIRACTLVGFKMTIAKLSIFVEPDGFDATDGDPLVKIIAKPPRNLIKMVRLANGVCDINARPQWLEWGAKLRIRYDRDQFTESDIVNLISRAGLQVGICEGRPASTNSNGCGWGTFKISSEKEVMALLEKNDTKEGE